MFGRSSGSTCYLYTFDNNNKTNNIFNYEDLEWKIIYVGSGIVYTHNIYLKLYHALFSFPAESETYDQVLDTVYVGPVPEGRHMFVFQAEPPQPSKIPVADAVGVTVVLLTCSYRSQEFIRVG
jgi:histone chaperone ASF1